MSPIYRLTTTTTNIALISNTTQAVTKPWPWTRLPGLCPLAPTVGFKPKTFNKGSVPGVWTPLRLHHRGSKCELFQSLVNKLPAEYAAAVEKSKKGVQTWYQHVQQCDLTEAQTNQLASTIQVLHLLSHFSDYIVVISLSVTINYSKNARLCSVTL